jgi:PilZ domain-containing protein
MPSLNRLQSALSNLGQLVGDFRGIPRRRADAAVFVCWRDGWGRIIHSRARCVDISHHGARLECAEPVTMPAVVEIRDERGVVQKTGRVRHVTHDGSQYEIGVEFCGVAEMEAELRGQKPR